MVMTFEESKELEGVKHHNKRELLLMQDQDLRREHDRKMERLEKLLEIAKAGGKVDYE